MTNLLTNNYLSMILAVAKKSTVAARRSIVFPDVPLQQNLQPCNVIVPDAAQFGVLPDANGNSPLPIVRGALQDLVDLLQEADLEVGRQGAICACAEHGRFRAAVRAAR